MRGITDHNSGAWIDLLKEKLKELEESKPAWYRRLYLFPGVEISVSGNVHILAIFGFDKNGNHIDRLLGAVDYRGNDGDSSAVTTKSVTQVVDAIADLDGIAIPAHVDKKKGLFCQFQGPTLKDVLQNEIFTQSNCVTVVIRSPNYTQMKRCNGLKSMDPILTVSVTIDLVHSLGSNG